MRTIARGRAVPLRLGEIMPAMSTTPELAPMSGAPTGWQGWLTRPAHVLTVAALLGVLAYSLGLRTGFVSDDYGWLRHAARGELGWDASLRFAGHSNALPLEIALYHLKFTLFGFNSGAYHVFSVVGHVGNVLLVYLLARRLALSAYVASLAAVMAAVVAAGSQAVYWMSGDPHVWATLATLAAVILYIDYREQGGWWRYGCAVVLALAAPLVKSEGVAVVAGVIAYELIRSRPASFGWKIAPFLLAPIPFIVWEWTTQDQLRTQRGLGLNVIQSGVDYLRQIFLPIDPGRFFAGGGGLLHHLLRWTLGGTLYAEGAALALLLILGLWRRPAAVVLFLGLAGTAPALVVTLGTQSRYAYLAGLLAALIAAMGAGRLYEWTRGRIPHRWLMSFGLILVTAVVGVEMWKTIQQSSDLRAAYAESTALRAAVLIDHSSVPDGTQICIVNSPLDIGSATAVFADPRLGPGVGIPVVSKCASAAGVPSGVWGYVRQSDGSYMEVR